MSLQDQFKKIIATNDLRLLTPFKESTSWQSLTHDERELLGLLFIKQGEQQVNKGDSKVEESLELATQVAPHSAEVFFRKAVFYAAQGQHLPCLLAANDALEKTTQLNPNAIAAWHAWGNILTRIALINDNADYFHEADKKFRTSLELIEKRGSVASSHLMWHWACCWYQIGIHSGEAVDLLQALEKFRGASLAGCDEGDFHNDFGNVLVELSTLLGRKDLLIEAIDHYKKFAMLSPFQFEAWYNYGACYMRLYQLSPLPGYFQEAKDCFERAMELNPEDSLGWFRWAELESFCGRVTRDVQKIYNSIEKFEKAYKFDSDNPEIILKWGEAQMQVGSCNDHLESLRDGENKITAALARMPENAEAWYIYGILLSEYGRYFSSEEYYLKAIESYKRGLSLNSTHPFIMHGIALALFYLGDLKGEPKLLEESVGYFNRIAENKMSIISQFFSDWGVTLMKLGEMTDDKNHIEAAAEKFEQAIGRRLDGTYGDEVELECFYNYGCALDFLGDFHQDPVYYEKAVQVLSHVLKLDADYINARYNLALAYYHLGEINGDVENLKKANEIFHGLIQFDPEDDEVWCEYGLSLLNLVILSKNPEHGLDGKQLASQTEAKFLQAVALGSLNADYNLACLYALTGNHPAAMHYLERADQNDVLPSLDDLLNDVWLENLHDYQPFRNFVSYLLNKEED